MADYTNFRQRLDAVLRTLDVGKVQQFMLDEDQWDEGTPADPSFAMWMMIAGSQSLSELHPQAREWLLANGHEEAAQAVLGRMKVGSGGKGQQGGRGQNRGGQGQQRGGQGGAREQNRMVGREQSRGQQMGKGQNRGGQTGEKRGYEGREKRGNIS